MSKLKDGFSTTVGFAQDSSVLLYEKEVTPVGLDGGGVIDITSMRNTTYRTFAEKSLVTVTEGSFTALYNPAVYDEILAMINVNQLITITEPDLSTVAFWGVLTSFIPGAHVEGTAPLATVTIAPTNRNGSDVETAPVYAAAP